MECKPWYPADFNQALLNTFTEETLKELLERPDCAPRFVYGVLCFPTVLRYMLYQISPKSPPVVVETSNPHDTVHGMLVLGLDVNQRNLIYELEGGLMNLVDVRAQIRLKDGSLPCHDICSGRMVDAGICWTDRDCSCKTWDGNRWFFFCYHPRLVVILNRRLGVLGDVRIYDED
ncbi:hypothetical protein AFLA_011562 [Aspergillus flavus NRRL3357]|nr:hypothetical protein AFLA_011562 [Aspergillus flavus NRRL3357]